MSTSQLESVINQTAAAWIANGTVLFVNLFNLVNEWLSLLLLGATLFYTVLKIRSELKKKKDEK